MQPRETFAAEMSKRLEIDVIPVDSGAECVRDADVVTTITSARDPVLEGAWLREGTHTEIGRYTVEKWLEIYAAHAPGHAEQILVARSSLKNRKAS